MMEHAVIDKDFGDCAAAAAAARVGADRPLGAFALELDSPDACFLLFRRRAAGMGRAKSTLADPRNVRPLDDIPNTHSSGSMRGVVAARILRPFRM